MPALTLPARRGLAVIAALLAACSGGKEGPPPPPPLHAVPAACGTGTASLSGQLFAPNGTTPIGGAAVTIASAPGCTAYTADDGSFAFTTAPASATTATATKGLFSATMAIAPGAPATLVVPPGSVSLAYVPGYYDTIEHVLTRLGFTPTALISADLQTANLSVYDAVLLNCGLDEFYAGDPTAQANLQGYVAGGGRLYASDWAHVYVEGAFAGRINFLAPDPRVGEPAADSLATVVDAALATALGKSSAIINFDLGAWAVMDSAPGGTTVLLTGPATIPIPAPPYTTTLQGKPYAVQFAHGSGQVTYTSFHNEAQTTEDMDRLLEQMLFAL